MSFTDIWRIFKGSSDQLALYIRYCCNSKTTSAMTHPRFLWLFIVLLFASATVEAQYFGQNKPRYNRFDFRVYDTDNFSIYSYLESRDKLMQLAEWSEQWYELHQRVLKDTIEKRNPLILYNQHTHFQQTNAIMGPIGQGVGGVTEAFKNRVILPIQFTNKGTHHVLGHELVHAFQYNMILEGEGTSLRDMGNIPLWMIEGLAEYLSIGRHDPHTAMWMRDAYLHDDVPTLRDLMNPRYFPYRYGQTFWAFLTGLYGDIVIRPFFIAAAQLGLEEACKQVLGMDMTTLSELWVNSFKAHYSRLMPDRTERPFGKAILTDENAGEMNLSPVLSPDGRYVIFVSEKDLFSLDMFLADARTGRILRKVASTAREGHVDDFNTIESSATWSPRSDQFAFVATQKGRNILIIKDAGTGRTVEEIRVPGIEAINYPAWSPNGRRIAFSGMKEGESDIYTYELSTGRVQKLTDGPESEIMPAWSADGTEIVFSTDYLAYQRGGFPALWGFNIGIVDAVSGVRTDLDLFPGANNLNPLFDGNGDLLFLSDRDGFRNIYRYDRVRDDLRQVSHLVTGVSGITPYSPAMTVSFKRDRLLYTHFSNGKYRVNMVDMDDLEPISADKHDVNFRAATLPVTGREVEDWVNTGMEEAHQTGPEMVFLREEDFRPRFRLDYIGGGGGMGVGIGNNFIGTGTAMMGGVDFLFSDILGNNLLFATLIMNGEVSDIGGIMQYLNQKHAVGWGVRAMHIPFRAGVSYYAGLDTLPGTPVLADVFHTDIQRVFRSQGGLFAQYPFSPFQRLEVSSNYIRFSFLNERFRDYYVGGFYQGRERVRLQSFPGFNLYTTGGAWVGDRSQWGFTSPLRGYRFRIGAEQYMGNWNFQELTFDTRRYVWMKPFTLATRFLYFGRHGRDGANFQPMYIGDPMLVRGYTGKSFDRFGDYNLNIEQMIGSQLLVTTVEWRLPFTGPRRLALIPSSFLFTDLNFFLDGGMAFTRFNQLQWNMEANTEPRPVFSAGVSLRVNLFGALILEPFYAWPLQENTKPVFGLNFIPGF